jgi:hypothetical protein
MKTKISISLKNKFVFNANHENPVKHLKDVTANVPETDGLYYVFAKANSSSPNHLVFDLDKQQYELIYFGIAGGVTKNGKEGKQKLKGRINNVVGSSSIKRAKYWQQEMHKQQIEEFIVFYLIHPNPQVEEATYYTYLNTNGLIYPLLNKKRGRPNK